jgi:hypothetical protein
VAVAVAVAVAAAAVGPPHRHRSSAGHTCRGDPTTSAVEGIVLKKSFWGDERNFLEPLMRITRGDVRDHIDSSKIDHRPS